MIPKNGGVLIIDDSSEEGLALLKALSKNNFAAKYFSGERSELPANPLQGIRMVFLDIVLNTEGQDETTRLSKVVNVLETIIGRNNVCPYVLVLWTKEQDLIHNLLSRLATQPVKYVDLEKPECKNEKGEYDINIIQDKIFEKLHDKDSHNLLTVWENIVLDSSAETIHTISSLYDSDVYWNKNMMYVFFKLAQAQIGRNAFDAADNELFRNALLTFGNSLVDKIENRLINESYSNYLYKPLIKHLISHKVNDEVYTIKRLKSGKYSLFINGKKKGESKAELDKLKSNVNDAQRKDIIDEAVRRLTKIKPSLNTSFLFDTQPVNYLRPGNVYNKNIDGRKKRSLLKTYFKTSQLNAKTEDKKYKIKNFSKVFFIEMEVTPICDFAQKKWLKSRLLPGIIFPADFKPETNASDSLFKELPVFKYQNNDYKIIFDFRLLKSLDTSHNHNTPPLFRLRIEPLSCILSRLSSHINRIGITSID